MSNIFEMRGGNLFPDSNRQRLWIFAKGNNHIRFFDGTHTYSFEGQLAAHETLIQKIPDVPLPDMFINSTSRGRIQVHRSDAKTIHFTFCADTIEYANGADPNALTLGNDENFYGTTDNPTYTFVHQEGNTWKAIPVPSEDNAPIATRQKTLDSILKTPKQNYTPASPKSRKTTMHDSIKKRSKK